MGDKPGMYVFWLPLEFIVKKGVFLKSHKDNGKWGLGKAVLGFKHFLNGKKGNFMTPLNND